MKIAPVTKIAALLALSAGVALTGCTQQADDDQITPNIPTGFEDDSSESTEDGSQHNEVPQHLTDFIYVTEDGTAVRCIGSVSSKSLSCDWEGATRPSDTEDSVPDEDAESE